MNSQPRHSPPVLDDETRRKIQIAELEGRSTRAKLVARDRLRYAQKLDAQLAELRAMQ